VPFPEQSAPASCSSALTACVICLAHTHTIEALLRNCRHTAGPRIALESGAETDALVVADTASSANHYEGGWESVDQGFDSTPPSSAATRDDGAQLHTQPFGGSDDEHDDDVNNYGAGRGSEPAPRRKPGAYHSRVEQMLFDHPELPILITDAGKSSEGNGKFTAYTIRTGDLEVRRRYSEFSSLREALVRLHPTLIIPPIPEKHTVADYAANPTNAKQDQPIIDLRKRMLAVFLNRCRRMDQVLGDGVWWRFLDPNASWSEVMNSPPISMIPKHILKAPPLNPAEPTPGHLYLPVPPASAKLKALGGAIPPPDSPNLAALGITRFPPDSQSLSEQELDPYFVSYEASIKNLEQLMTGSMEKVNRRTLNHLNILSADFCELGSKYNALAISEQSQSLLAGIEKMGQAADTTYFHTEELAGALGASFAEPMRENAQFAGVVRSVLRYRVLKRVQQEMTNDELDRKRAHLDQLERSEAEAKRIEQYLSSSQQISSPPRRPTGSRDRDRDHSNESNQDDTASIDSDFHSHNDIPSANTGAPEPTRNLPLHKKIPSAGNSLTNKIFGPIRHAVQGVVDADPERSRRDMIGKTRESIEHLEQAQVVSEQDVKDASASILGDLKRFQGEKEEDLRRYMVCCCSVNPGGREEGRL
jgi:hypothetical protein